MKLARVKRGDPISADHWNALVDALEAAADIENPPINTTPSFNVNYVCC